MAMPPAGHPAGRNKCVIDYEQLKGLMKEHVAEPKEEWAHCEQLRLVKLYKPFFKELAEVTQRINPVALAQAARELFQLPKDESFLFGAAVAAAFATCKRAGDKAATGSKLSPDVKEVYQSMIHGQEVALHRRTTQLFGPELKHEPAVESEDVKVPFKKELGQNTPEHKGVKRSLSSPTQILSLYQITESTKQVKVAWPCAFKCFELLLAS